MSIKEVRMGGICSTHWTDEKCVQFFLPGILNGRDHSVAPGVDGKIILEWILGKSGGNM